MVSRRKSAASKSNIKKAQAVWEMMSPEHRVTMRRKSEPVLKKMGRKAKEAVEGIKEKMPGD
ncbi:MAG: hypothetical protein ACD_38C00179G0004 [uncultured bacterium]|nr:MAG: hypothetical protein ACD_38C00179G0004 [uncultured bacterium]KKQ82645.1 MAG: hypothetical protein UT04_C0053G0006 [Candidatus Daviesbacteria bacterium GW2011_GWF2_38_7]OGE22350.1 MAG: hypothetical protein A2778_00700 [Candidatus Daviesbacteria bacterium RIFCSPHIGHO2_01_FULL_40_24]OGE28437.1 MAG: hypothetical protein A3C29_05695 [Candidatus Daviesbacteria bacterium RIFCSPHIGHO2_02_FULL_40_16]OGE42068.1 MAG: hypothetical protein A3A53_04200 [Candidatus Daviesbacteria bacterium RIFCSPLOWO2